MWKKFFAGLLIALSLAGSAEAYCGGGYSCANEDCYDGGCCYGRGCR